MLNPTLSVMKEAIKRLVSARELALVELDFELGNISERDYDRLKFRLTPERITEVNDDLSRHLTLLKKAGVEANPEQLSVMLGCSIKVIMAILNKESGLI